jgi:hypothetical protein
MCLFTNCYNRILKVKLKYLLVTACYEICALLGHYAVQSGNSLLMFWDNLKKGMIGCSEMAVRNYHSTLHNIPEERFLGEA